MYDKWINIQLRILQYSYLLKTLISIEYCLSIFSEPGRMSGELMS